MYEAQQTTNTIHMSSHFRIVLCNRKNVVNKNCALYMSNLIINLNLNLIIVLHQIWHQKHWQHLHSNIL